MGESKKKRSLESISEEPPSQPISEPDIEVDQGWVVEADRMLQKYEARLAASQKSEMMAASAAEQLQEKLVNLRHEVKALKQALDVANDRIAQLEDEDRDPHAGEEEEGEVANEGQ